MCDKNKKCCLYEVLNAILNAQNMDTPNCLEGCSKPFLGPSFNNSYNTRPVNLYNGITGEMIEINYGNNKQSSIFRLECLDECCATFRILTNKTSEQATTSNNNLIDTGSFFTIDINTIVAVKCLKDTYVEI